MPTSRRRRRIRESQAERTHYAQKRAEKKRLTPAQYARRRAGGWTIVGLAIAVGISHWLAHVGVLYEDRPLYDLIAGFPMAGALGIIGAIVLSR